jgi:hypothetical protein|tara:strand:+ start:336 stop:518 length:183 start_codon:yes stop_codon:yes gene_type:complete
MEIFNTNTSAIEEITYLCDGQDMFGDIADVVENWNQAQTDKLFERPIFSRNFRRNRKEKA